jgi:deferrochelatase/peroxidase EfeB
MHFRNYLEAAANVIEARFTGNRWQGQNNADIGEVSETVVKETPKASNLPSFQVSFNSRKDFMGRWQLLVGTTRKFRPGSQTAKTSDVDVHFAFSLQSAGRLWIFVF